MGVPARVAAVGTPGRISLVLEAPAQAIFRTAAGTPGRTSPVLGPPARTACCMAVAVAAAAGTRGIGAPARSGGCTAVAAGAAATAGTLGLDRAPAQVRTVAAAASCRGAGSPGGPCACASTVGLDVPWLSQVNREVDWQARKVNGFWGISLNPKSRPHLRPPPTQVAADLDLGFAFADVAWALPQHRPSLLIASTYARSAVGLFLGRAQGVSDTDRL